MTSKTRERKTELVAFKLTPSQLARMRHFAEQDRCKLSTFVRTAIDRHIAHQAARLAGMDSADLVPTKSEKVKS